MGQWWNYTSKGNAKYWEGNSSQCHFVHFKSHMDWPGVECWPLCDGPVTSVVVVTRKLGLHFGRRWDCIFVTGSRPDWCPSGLLSSGYEGYSDRSLKLITQCLCPFQTIRRCVDYICYKVGTDSVYVKYVGDNLKFPHYCYTYTC